MGFRLIKFPQTNIPDRVAERLRSLPEYTPQAEAFAEGMLTRLRPLIARFYVSRRRLATGAVLALTAWLFVHIVFGANGMVIYRQKRAEFNNLEKTVSKLQKENQDYTEQIKALKSDPEMIEKEAREQLHYTRPGEVVYVTPAPSPANGTNVRSAQK